jgi:NADH-quinone oxidoreductase subunit J
VIARLAPIVLALVVIGLVFGVAALMIVALGQDWADALLWLFAAVMLVSGLLVVTMRDIIRCGLAMIVCFGALAGIYVLMGAPLIALAIVATDWGEEAARVAVDTRDMAITLFTSFVFPFEIVSVLLLAAVIGGVFLAKREPGGPS